PSTIDLTCTARYGCALPMASISTGMGACWATATVTGGAGAAEFAPEAAVLAALSFFPQPATSSNPASKQFPTSNRIYIFSLNWMAYAQRTVHIRARKWQVCWLRKVNFGLDYGPSELGQRRAARYLC